MAKTRIEARPSIRRFAFAQRLLRMSGVWGFVLLAACTEPPPTRIDGSSREAFTASISQARDDLPIADRILFDEAINTVAARRYGNRDPEQLARSSFDGMTAAEVVATERGRTIRRR